MTLRNWGELPADLQGSWVLRIEDKDSSLDHGVLHSWRLEILGNDSSGEVSGTLTAECAANPEVTAMSSEEDNVTRQKRVTMN